MPPNRLSPATATASTFHPSNFTRETESVIDSPVSLGVGMTSQAGNPNISRSPPAFSPCSVKTAQTPLPETSRDTVIGLTARMDAELMPRDGNWATLSVRCPACPGVLLLNEDAVVPEKKKKEVPGLQAVPSTPRMKKQSSWIESMHDKYILGKPEDAEFLEPPRDSSPKGGLPEGLEIEPHISQESGDSSVTDEDSVFGNMGDDGIRMFPPLPYCPACDAIVAVGRDDGERDAALAMAVKYRRGGGVLVIPEDIDLKSCTLPVAPLVRSVSELEVDAPNDTDDPVGCLSPRSRISVLEADSQTEVSEEEVGGKEEKELEANVKDEEEAIYDAVAETEAPEVKAGGDSEVIETESEELPLPTSYEDAMETVHALGRLGQASDIGNVENAMETADVLHKPEAEHVPNTTLQRAGGDDDMENQVSAPLPRPEEVEDSSNVTSTTAPVRKEAVESAEEPEPEPEWDLLKKKEDEMIEVERAKLLENYEARRAIATKILGAKLSRGYTIHDVPCEVCTMPLMLKKGKLVDCVVCPALVARARKTVIAAYGSVAKKRDTYELEKKRIQEAIEEARREAEEERLKEEARIRFEEEAAALEGQKQERELEEFQLAEREREETTRRAEELRQRAEEIRKASEDSRRKAQQRGLARTVEDEARRTALEEARKRAEDLRKLAVDEAQRNEEELAAVAREGGRRLAEERAKREEDDTRRRKELEFVNAQAEEARRAAEEACRVAEAEARKTAEEVKMLAVTRRKVEADSVTRDAMEKDRMREEESRWRKEEKARTSRILELEREKKLAADALTAAQIAAHSLVTSANSEESARLRNEVEREKEAVELLVRERMEIEAQLLAIKEAERTAANQKVTWVAEDQHRKRKVLEEQQMRLESTWKKSQLLQSQRQELDHLVKEAENAGRRIAALGQQGMFPLHEQNRLLETNQISIMELLKKRDDIDAIIMQTEEETSKEDEMLSRMKDDFRRLVDYRKAEAEASRQEAVRIHQRQEKEKILLSEQYAAEERARISKLEEFNSNGISSEVGARIMEGWTVIPGKFCQPPCGGPMMNDRHNVAQCVKPSCPFSYAANNQVQLQQQNLRQQVSGTLSAPPSPIPPSPFRKARPPLPRSGPTTPLRTRSISRSNSINSFNNRNHNQDDWDNHSQVSMHSTASSVKSVADEALSAILDQMETAKIQLATETDVEKQLNLANLLEKLASAASSMKKLEHAYA